jgi:Beta-ketoacyl synthase, N-terminal domain
MREQLGFSINSWSAWAPGLDNPEAWKEWTRSTIDLPTNKSVPDVKDLPAGLRRRLSTLGKMALRVALDTENVAHPRIVFSSRYGNVSQTLQLLQSMAVDEPISPTGFGMSVHNSLIGMLSIVAKNTESQSAVAAGVESFCLGLLEALALLNDNPEEPVLLIHCDDELPEFYASFQDKSVSQCALALLIHAPEKSREYLTLSFSGAPTAPAQGDPLASFLRFIIREDTSWSWSGRQGRWQCQRHV